MAINTGHSDAFGPISANETGISAGVCARPAEDVATMATSATIAAAARLKEIIFRGFRAATQASAKARRFFAR